MSYPYQVTNQTDSGHNVLTHMLREHRDTKNMTNTEPNMQDKKRYQQSDDGRCNQTSELPQYINWIDGEQCGAI